MPESERRRPRAAFCEEFDEENQTTRPGTQTSANVSAKRSDQDLVIRQREKVEFYLDGGDSGYASRAATTISDATTSSRRKMPDLKLDTAGIRERERNPYSYSQSAAPKTSIRRQASTQAKEPSPEKRSTKSRDDPPERGHPDPYAKHSEPKHSARAAHPPPSPVAVRMAVPKGSKDDQALPPKTRRPSSNQHPRPVSMAHPNGAYPIQYAMYPAYAAVPGPTSGYSTPVTPSVPYGPMPYSYAVPPPTPSYATYPPPPSYFEQLPEPRSARPSRHTSPVRRSNGYGDPVIRQGYPDSGMAVLERVSSKESRPVLPSHKSARSIEVDRVNMPPPARPHQPEAVPSRRPSTRRSQTYHPNEPTVREIRERIIVDPDQYDSDDDREYHYVRPAPVTAVRERRESSTRPPTSFRPLHAEPRERPQARKSVSYSAGTTVTKVATSTPNAMPRRMTVPLEQKEAEIEAYQAKRNSAAAAVVAGGLTHEALRKLEQGTSSSKSETGSNFSHQSSSKDSSGRDRSQTAATTKTSITLPGGMNVTIPEGYLNSRDSRPLSINIGGLVVSVAPEGKENERPREQKRIERAPSIASRTSKRSAASSVVSNPRGREMPALTSRRPSQLEERAPTSHRSSRQPSRAPSVTQRGHDYASRRQSVDYSRDAEYDRDRQYDDFYAAG